MRSWLMGKMSKDEEAVVARLQREFKALRPAFSEGLHLRVRQAIAGRHRRGGPAARAAAGGAPVSAVDGHRGGGLSVDRNLRHLAGNADRSRPRLPRKPASPAIRAAPHRGLGPVRSLSGKGGMTELADRVSAKLDAAVVSATQGRKWAYLDHDAKAVLRMPAARLPLDVLSSLLSLGPQKRLHSPAEPTGLPSKGAHLQEPAGVWHG